MILPKLSQAYLPIGSIDLYIRQVCSFPILSATEEYELAHQYRSTQDVQSAQKLVLTHLRYVVTLARRYLGYGLSLADLIQEGNIGLMKAVKRFDPSVGVRLSAFAVYWIKSEIHDFILKNWRMVRFVKTKMQKKLFNQLNKSRDTLEKEKISNALGAENRHVREMTQYLTSSDLSLSGPLNACEEEGEHYSIDIPDDQFSPQVLYEQTEQESMLKTLRQVLIDSFEPRQRDIIESRWFQEPKATLEYLSEKYGISKERVRQIETQSLKKLKGILLCALKKRLN